MPLLFRIVLPNSRLHTVHDTFHFQAKELNFCISFSFLRWLFANSIRPPKGLHAVNLFATLELHQLAELRWESHETAVCRSTWDSDICSFCSSRSKTHAALSGKLNAPIWNTVPFLSPVFCDVQIKLRLQIDLDLLLRSPRQCSKPLPDCLGSTMVPSVQPLQLMPFICALHPTVDAWSGTISLLFFACCDLVGCHGAHHIYFPHGTCYTQLLQTEHRVSPVLTTNYSPQWGKPD